MQIRTVPMFLWARFSLQSQASQGLTLCHIPQREDLHTVFASSLKRKSFFIFVLFSEAETMGDSGVEQAAGTPEARNREMTVYGNHDWTNRLWEQRLIWRCLLGRAVQ
jgi:hypothetical protein